MWPGKVQLLVPADWQLLKLQASIQCAPNFSIEIHSVSGKAAAAMSSCSLHMAGI